MSREDGVVWDLVVPNINLNCDGCKKLAETIGVLHRQSENYRKEAEMWKTVHFRMSDMMRRIFDIAGEGMWYPSSKTEREKCDEISKAYCDVQDRKQ